MKHLFVTALLLLTCISFAQQENYPQLWKKVDSLEILGLVESADRHVSEIISSAIQKKDYTNLIKAKIYHYKFYQINHEKSNVYILADVNKTISNIPAPYKNVLLSYKASILQQYFQDNRWKSRSRTEIDNPDKDDLETWSLQTLQDSIQHSLEKSLEQEEKLISTPAGEVENLLYANHLNRKYKPTLFDVLAHKAIEHYSNSSNFISINPEDVLSLDSPWLYSPTSQFVKISFPEASKHTSGVKVLQIYQKLERLHSAEENPLPKVFAQLNRLDYVNNNYTGKNKWELHTEALEHLSEQYEGKAVQSLILITRALSLYDRSTETDDEGKLINPEFLRKAVELSEKITKEFPNSDAAQKAFQLISTITAENLDTRIPEILAPKEPGRIYISYKALDTLQMKIFRVPENFAEQLTYRNRDSIIYNYSRNASLFQEQFILPKADDYNKHSTEVVIPGLETGNYLVYLSGAKEKKDYNYGFLQVTGIALTQKSFDKYSLYHSLNRTTGELIGGVKLEFFNNYSSPTVKVTNSKGQITDFTSSNSERTGRIRASKNGDTLNTNFWPGYYRQYEEETDESLAKTMIYLDRAIYRPGQRVHFKGVLLQHVKNKTSTVANEYVEVYVDDPNGEEIAYFRLKTNKYGSFNGNFKLPASGITGEFEIYAEEDMEEDSNFWDEILEYGDVIYNSLTFNVEEYKRPTFEVKFDDIKETFKPGDTAVVSGSVRSFMGAGINNTDLVYEVTRQKLVKRWWYYNYDDPVPVIVDTMTTDAEGNFELKFPALADDDDLVSKNFIYQYNIKATVVDVSGETREASTSLKIGTENLLTKIVLPETVTTGDTLSLKIENTNLNENPVPVTGEVRIYKLLAPDRILKERLWEAPEINLITEEEFVKLFPEEPYDSELTPQEWPKGDLIYEAEFDIEGTYEAKISVANEWESGQYLVEAESTNGSNISTAKRSFEIVNPQDNYLADNQRFSFSIQNSDFDKDKEVKILLQTAYQDLKLEVAAYDSYKKIFGEFIKLNGKKEITIPLTNFSSQELEVQVTGVKNNSAIIVTKRIQLPQIQKQLTIETETFRNKIQPGIEETWSFNIKDEEKSIPDAEILASMYDASLDQFVTGNWNTAPGFGQKYVGFPSFNISNIGNTTSLFSTFSRKRQYRPGKLVFDKLNLFGFYFSRDNHYQYRNYLSQKKSIQNSTSLSGNTRGRITDEGGIPLPGVSIVIKGSNTGTQTDFDGEFALDTKVGDELIFSYVGFITHSYKVGEKKEIYIVLEEDAAHLDEVVTVGYGVQEKMAVAGSAARLLRGKVPGVAIQEHTTGSASVISIRGASTVDGQAAPLFVIDGKIVSSHDLDPTEILNVEILEGEAAVNIYGAQAANGVVIINTKAGLNELQNVEARKNLDETAFFFPNLQLGANGKLKFTFTSPEALTQWKLRLLGHTKDWTTGKYETTVLTQKELSLIPNPPRFLREGDTISFKSKVNNLSKGKLTGTAILQLFNALTMEPIDEILGNVVNIRNFDVEASNSTAVSWKLTIPKGVPAVTYRILAKAGDFTDGEENFLPVLTNRMLVSESLPIFVRAGSTETYNFKNLQDNISATLDHHKFSFEYSSNPAWYALQSLPYLMEPKFECSDQIFSSFYANSIAGHIMNSQPKIKAVYDSWKQDSTLVSDLEKNEELKSIILAETPWVLDAQSETAQKHRLAELFDTEKIASENEALLKRLYQMQNFSGAWPWFPGGKDNYFITRYIVGGLGHLEELGIEVNSSKMVEKAVSFLDDALLKAEKDHQKWSPNSDSFYKSVNNLHHLYVRGFFEDEYSLPADVKEISDKILKAHKTDWQELDLYNKGLLIMVLTRMQENDLAESIIASLKESAVKSEDYGMYWKENKPGWYWYRAPIETQALIIEAFTEAGGEEEAVEELKIWLLQNKRTNHWPTTKSTTEASYALLMQGKDWLQISDNTSVKIGGEEIKAEKLAETKKEAGTGYLKLSWQAAEISDSFSTIEVANKNSTAGYGGAYWQYFEELDKIKGNSDSPLNVEKELYLNVSDRNGKTLKRISQETQLKTGDLVTVRLVVRTTADMDFIHLKDMRASGFEPTNVLSEYKYQDGTAYYESTKDAATHFFFDALAKGTYVLEYTVRANNPGNFSNGITLIESMYAPEFSSHTKGIRVNINE